MKKIFFFILLIILIIIIFSYNYCYEHFSVKVQDAMKFKDYNDNLVGTYPDINMYPDLFIKSNGEYVNMIGTVYGVSEIKIPKPKDGKKGPKGDQGPQGIRGPPGPEGKNGKELVQEDEEEYKNSTCIVPGTGGGISFSRGCKGPDGDSPSAPPDGTPGERCPHSGGKCPKGFDGVPGQTCKERYGINALECPPQENKRGPDGDTCEKVNNYLDIKVLRDASGIMRKCPPGQQGDPGLTCEKVNGDKGIKVLSDAEGVKRICPVQPNGNNGSSCYEVLKNQELPLPECIESTPGVDSVNCVNKDSPNVKICGVINPKKPSDVANDLSINEYNGNTLTINNNKAITFKGNKITLPENGNIVLKDGNNIIKTIDKSYIDYMISKSKQCKKCPVKDGKKRWNNSPKGCEEDQGECRDCSECKSGEYVKQACSEHSNTLCSECVPGYVGIRCMIKCDPEKGEIPRDDKTACKTIGSNKYIDPNDNTKEINIPNNKYRNTNDARLLNDIPYYKYRDPNSNTLNNCPVCSATQYSSGSCGGSTSNNKNCIYDFSSQKSLATWKAYATQIGGTTNISHYYTASQLSGSHGNEHGVFKGGAEMGYFDLPLPSQFNKIKITFRNVYNKADGVVKIKIGGKVISQQIGMSATETTQFINYNEGDHFRIEEGHSIWSANLKIELS